MTILPLVLLSLLLEGKAFLYEVNNLAKETLLCSNNRPHVGSSLCSLFRNVDQVSAKIFFFLFALQIVAFGEQFNFRNA
jgi:hypothetical protein